MRLYKRKSPKRKSRSIRGRRVVRRKSRSRRVRRKSPVNLNFNKKYYTCDIRPSSEG